ncbi:HupE/UreJ family protein [Kordiimonas sp. SCSIO 12603]|uniref:HupE/UreJ family protein n=1 Tax=Kordiimonas sp. SCSIO 12603 TaxID=2829596 RepID=UPI002103FFD0|nr:HupE/UreJ family protein [Kordiimonas sp. SCSIO 12603]UTW59785.1 HupE/UreJ family protein [Kordiimonas sp. SCSIO 12603]
MRLLFGLLLLIFSLPTSAHEGRPVYVEVIEGTEKQWQLRWKIPPVLPTGAEPNIDLIGDCQLTAGTHRPQLLGAKFYECRGSVAAVTLTYPHTNPALSTLVLYQKFSGEEHTIIKGPEELTIPLPKARTFWSVAYDYTIIGADHILEGYDHLLFVLCLMLLAATPKRVLLTVTGFTLGHSITLGMSALAQLSLPPELVEPLITFSILMLAAEIMKGDKTTLTYRYPILVAAGFGLLHGFGFGGALTEIGLPYGLQLQALAFFNIGVEIGQIVFVLLAYGFYWLLLHIKPLTPHKKRLHKLALYPTGSVAAFWTIERIISVLG